MKVTAYFNDGHDEDVTDGVRLTAVGAPIPPAHGLEMLVALERLDLRVGAQDDLRVLLDAADEIA